MKDSKTRIIAVYRNEEKGGIEEALAYVPRKGFCILTRTSWGDYEINYVNRGEKCTG